MRETLAQTTNTPPNRLPVSPPPSTCVLSVRRRDVLLIRYHSRKGDTTSRKRAFPGDHQTQRGSASTSGDNQYTINLRAHASSLPPGRAAELSSLPVVSVDLGSPNASPETFTRESLKNILGGAIQGLVVRYVQGSRAVAHRPEADMRGRSTKTATELARKRKISEYLCPNMDHNAWCPAGPGQHGYMQVGLGRDSKRFNGDGEEHHVFVGAGKFLIYCGFYHVQRVDRVTKEEWETLPAKVNFVLHALLYAHISDPR